MKTKPAPAAATNGEAIAAPPSEYEYRTELIFGRADRTLNSYARSGWELVATNSGGFDTAGRWTHCALSLYFRRQRRA